MTYNEIAKCERCGFYCGDPWIYQYKLPNLNQTVRWLVRKAQDEYEKEHKQKICSWPVISDGI